MLSMILLVSKKEIEQQKNVIRVELNKRKQLKIKVAQMDKINSTLNETLTKYVK